MYLTWAVIVFTGWAVLLDLRGLLPIVGCFCAYKGLRASGWWEDRMLRKAVGGQRERRGIR